jgi:hypothetical protein
VAFRIVVDGVAKDGCGARLNPSNEPQSLGVQQLIAGLAIGVHTIKIQWKTTGSTVNIRPVTVPDTESANFEVTEYA